MDSFILSTRSKANGAFGTDVGPGTYLKVPPDAAEPSPIHSINSAKQWMTAILEQAAPAKGTALDVVFFVHGYNTPSKEALTRQRLIERELRARNYPCMVVGFDWPSESKTLLYLADRGKAQDSAALLVKRGIVPFMTFSLPECPINVHVMAHSMGAFVVREAFRSVDKMRDSGLANDWRIGQMVLFGADISSSCFALGNSDMIPTFSHCGRLTNYFSGYDEALAVSNAKNIDTSSRVGRVGMPEDTPADDKALDVDCGPRYLAVKKRKFEVIDGLVSHSWYLEDANWYDDLAYTLQGGIDRNFIPSRTLRMKNDFVLN
ncbi:alpha/beta hydrolase [Pseudomonas sp. SLFW]|uniref:alpha/beta hydrolase n=1 Tax=Pseudomonas sp. SLFW TaxID=2683259 RepID=UPI0021155A2C|nr:alpha/beta hydrolase [Pseudomonas sp. SLFW]